MRIWIDLTNSPHVNFFADMIERLQQDHEVVLTCRPLANTIDLLKLKGFPYYEVGSHYGANKVKKGVGFGVRVWQLYRFLRKRQIDVAISHSSFYSPVVARLLGIRSIYINDNEHAAGNKISFLSASTIMVPEFLSMDSVRRQWGNPKKVIHYPGVKEGVYLANMEEACDPARRSGTTEIFIRPEPWTAQYYRGAVNFMDDLIVKLKCKHRIILMPRGDEQAEHYRQAQFEGVTIPSTPLSLEAIASRCALFIGAGGTMTREAAVLGIPTISVYQGALLAVDRYLIEQGHMTHETTPTLEFVESFLETTESKPPSYDLLRKGSEAARLMEDVLLNRHHQYGSLPHPLN